MENAKNKTSISIEENSLSYLKGMGGSAEHTTLIIKLAQVRFSALNVEAATRDQVVERVKAISQFSSLNQWKEARNGQPWEDVDFLRAYWTTSVYERACNTKGIQLSQEQKEDFRENCDLVALMTRISSRAMRQGKCSKWSWFLLIQSFSLPLDVSLYTARQQADLAVCQTVLRRAGRAHTFRNQLWAEEWMRNTSYSEQEAKHLFSTLRSIDGLFGVDELASTWSLFAAIHLNVPTAVFQAVKEQTHQIERQIPLAEVVYRYFRFAMIDIVSGGTDRRLTHAAPVLRAIWGRVDEALRSRREGVVPNEHLSVGPGASGARRRISHLTYSLSPLVLSRIARCLFSCRKMPPKGTYLRGYWSWACSCRENRDAVFQAALHLAPMSRTSQDRQKRTA